MNKTGRPVLVGTTSVEQSEFLASQLQKDGTPPSSFLTKLASCLNTASRIVQLISFWADCHFACKHALANSMPICTGKCNALCQSDMHLVAA